MTTAPLVKGGKAGKDGKGSKGRRQRPGKGEKSGKGGKGGKARDRRQSPRRQAPPTPASSRSRSASWPRASALPPMSPQLIVGAEGDALQTSPDLGPERQVTFVEEGMPGRTAFPARSPTPGRRCR